MGLPAYISIHAPREGRDPRFHEPIKRTEIFQSTRPSRGATSDKRQFVIDRLFQSTRPARGATLQTNTRDIIDAIFQSTRPARGATLQNPREA